MESFETDETQLAKVRIHLSRFGNHFVSKSFTSSVTPPPSPRSDPEDGDEDDERPPHSYVRLVIFALLDSPGRQATIREIYARITRRFPYYRENRLHWKNSVRHNLTVFSCFERIANVDVEKPSRGSYLWRLVGDWQGVLDKEDSALAKRNGLVVPNAPPIQRANPISTSHHVDKTKVDRRTSKLERERAKRKKREKARKLKLKAEIRRAERLPLADFNFCTPIKKEDQQPLPSRMPTPPPKLPGIENVFLSSPAPSTSPTENASSDILVESPEFRLRESAHLCFDDIADSAFKCSLISEDYCDSPTAASDDRLFETGGTECDVGADLHHHIMQHPTWYDDPHDINNPAQSISEWSTEFPSGYTPPSTNTTIWDLVEPEIDGMIGLLTRDLDWLSSPSFKIKL